jgi:HSP20 family molecular chaperone IbpA
MAENALSPDICIYPDEKFETLNIEISLPGVEKKNIDLNMYEEGFYVVAKKEGVKYVGTHTLASPVDPNKAIASYANGVLKINVPYKRPFKEAKKIAID